MGILQHPHHGLEDWLKFLDEIIEEKKAVSQNSSQQAAMELDLQRQLEVPPRPVDVAIPNDPFALPILTQAGVNLEQDGIHLAETQTESPLLEGLPSLTTPTLPFP